MHLVSGLSKWFTYALFVEDDVFPVNLSLFLALLLFLPV